MNHPALGHSYQHPSSTINFFGRGKAELWDVVVSPWSSSQTDLPRLFGDLRH